MSGAALVFIRCFQDFVVFLRVVFVCSGDAASSCFQTCFPSCVGLAVSVPPGDSLPPQLGLCLGSVCVVRKLPEHTFDVCARVHVVLPLLTHTHALSQGEADKRNESCVRNAAGQVSLQQRLPACFCSFQVNYASSQACHRKHISSTSQARNI